MTEHERMNAASNSVKDASARALAVNDAYLDGRATHEQLHDALERLCELCGTLDNVSDGSLRLERRLRHGRHVASVLARTLTEHTEGPTHA